ncbi:MAG: TonB-dependent receptor [Bryobacteraceae bacterium]
MDQNFGDKTRLFGRYSQQRDVRLVPGPLPGPIGGGRSTTDTYRQAVADLTHVFSSSLLANAQFAFSRALAAQFGLSKGFNLADLGLPASLAALGTDQFIQGSIADIGGIANGSDSFVQYQPRNVWTTRASVAKIRGSHNLKAGVDWRILNFNEAQNTQPNGTYTFGRTFTQGPNPVQATRNGGFGYADFLLGMPNGGGIRQLTPISTQGGYFALFVQDDWRINDRLTINVGVRWDRGTGNREKFGRLAYFDPDAANPLGTRAGLPNLKGVLRWIGAEGAAGNQLSTPMNNFGPRFGFAYKVTAKSVLRGGYGIFYAPRSVVGNGNGAIEAFRDTPLVGSIDGGLTNSSRLSNPFPQGVLPAVNARDPLANVGATIGAPVQPYKTGYAQLFSLNYQFELPHGILMQAGYSGNKGTHLLSGGWNINQLPDQYLALGNQLNNQVANPFRGLIAAGALSGATISLRQSLLPFPQYSGDGGVSQVFVPAGNDTYHSFTVQAEKRLSESVTFLTSYTRSKAIDDVGGMIDVYNRRLNKVLSGFDTPNIWIGSWVYHMPFGKGRAHGSNWRGATNAILGGWDLDGIARVQSGQPVAIGGNNIGRSAKLDSPTLARWFDTSAFVNTPAFTFQTTGPRSPDVRNDFTRNLDAVLVKNFTPTIKDRELGIQFRAECFNVTNTPQFASPNGTVTSQAFGQVTAQRNTGRQFQFGLKVKF